MSLNDKVITETYNFMSLISKIILLSLSLSLSLSAADKTQYFVHLSFNSILQLSNGFRVISKVT